MGYVHAPKVRSFGDITAHIRHRDPGHSVALLLKTAGLLRGRVIEKQTLPPSHPGTRRTKGELGNADRIRTATNKRTSTAINRPDGPGGRAGAAVPVRSSRPRRAAAFRTGADLAPVHLVRVRNAGVGCEGSAGARRSTAGGAPYRPPVAHWRAARRVTTSSATRSLV